MKPTVRSHPSLEHLEDRTCPAITAVQVGGVLTLTGAVTTPGDTLQITQTTPGIFTIQDGASAVTITGTPGTVTLLRAYLTSADDKVNLDLNGNTFAGNVLLSLGRGNNELTVHDGTIGSCLYAYGSTGDDDVILNNVNVNQHTFINLNGGAADTLQMTGTNVLTGSLTAAYINDINVNAGTTVNQNAVIYGGNSTNLVQFDGDVGGTLAFLGPCFFGNLTGTSSLTLGSNASVGQNLIFSSSWFNANGANLTLQTGSSVGRDVYFYGTGLVDNVTLSGTVGRNAVVVGYGGNDVVNVNSTATIQGIGYFDLGAGNDTLNVNGQVGSGSGTGLIVYGGSGNDNVTMDGSTAQLKGNVSIDLGSGDDTFTISPVVGGSFFTGTTFNVNGGLGTDIANLGGFGGATLMNFETTNP